MRGSNNKPLRLLARPPISTVNLLQRHRRQQPQTADITDFASSNDLKGLVRITGNLITMIDDPKAFVKPWTNTIPPKLVADGELIEAFCENQMFRLQHWNIPPMPPEPPSPQLPPEQH